MLDVSMLDLLDRENLFWPQGYKKTCSTQLSMKFQLLIKQSKMLKNKHFTLLLDSVAEFILHANKKCRHFNIYAQFMFYA